MNDGDAGLLSRYLQPFLNEREAAWQEMVERIQDEVVAYTSFFTPDEEAGWAEGVLLLLELFLDLAVQGRWLTADDAQAIRNLGAKQFDQWFEENELRASVAIAIDVARTRLTKDDASTSPGDKDATERVLAILERFGNEVEEVLIEGWKARRDEVAIGSPETAKDQDGARAGR
jgi:hypothetical protein